MGIQFILEVLFTDKDYKKNKLYGPFYVQVSRLSATTGFYITYIVT